MWRPLTRPGEVHSIPVTGATAFSAPERFFKDTHVPLRAMTIWTDDYILSSFNSHGISTSIVFLMNLHYDTINIMNIGHNISIDKK